VSCAAGKKHAAVSIRTVKSSVDLHRHVNQSLKSVTREDAEPSKLAPQSHQRRAASSCRQSAAASSVSLDRVSRQRQQVTSSAAGQRRQPTVSTWPQTACERRKSYHAQLRAKQKTTVQPLCDPSKSSQKTTLQPPCGHGKSHLKTAPQPPRDLSKSSQKTTLQPPHGHGKSYLKTAPQPPRDLSKSSQKTALQPSHSSRFLDHRKSSHYQLNANKKATVELPQSQSCRDRRKSYQAELVMRQRTILAVGKKVTPRRYNARNSKTPAPASTSKPAEGPRISTPSTSRRVTTMTPSLSCIPRRKTVSFVTPASHKTTPQLHRNQPVSKEMSMRYLYAAVSVGYRLVFFVTVCHIQNTCFIP